MKEIELKQSLHIRDPAWYKFLEPQSEQTGGNRKSSAEDITLAAPPVQKRGNWFLVIHVKPGGINPKAFKVI